MEERGKKTITCSVLFLDIAEYSKKSVAEQISLRDRFNSYLSAAIRDVPVADRIILDTGDGAAINFLGDVEDALKAARSLRESLLAEGPNVGPQLLVRMGINLGPVRVVMDINGQPNIVGDGINVAQRVMGFADPAQILVSRSYYDMVSRLSPQYAGMFHYQGSRTDKHVREHEVYAIGYPGDITTHRKEKKPVIPESADRLLTMLTDHATKVYRYAGTKSGALINFSIARFQQASKGLRAFYLGIAALLVLLPIVLLASLARHGDTSVARMAPEKSNPGDTQPGSSAAVAAVQADVNANSGGLSPAHPKPKHKARKSPVERRTVTGHPEKKQSAKSQAMKEKNVAAASSGNGPSAYIQVSCKEGTEVFLDGARKGRIVSDSLTIKVPSGSHTLIVSNSNGGIFTQNVEIVSGKTLHIRPGFCD